MFDKIESNLIEIVKEVKINNGPVNITQKRAVTDESVALLKEMQEKARDSIIGYIKSDDNKFNCTACMYNDNLYAQYVIITKYTINGQERIVKTNLDYFEIKDSVKCLTKVKEDIAKDFANLVCGLSVINYYDSLIRAGYNG